MIDFFTIYGDGFKLTEYIVWFCDSIVRYGIIAVSSFIAFAADQSQAENNSYD